MVLTQVAQRLVLQALLELVVEEAVVGQQILAAVLES